jgi:hypothetical protein
VSHFQSVSCGTRIMTVRSQASGTAIILFSDPPLQRLLLSGTMFSLRRSARSTRCSAMRCVCQALCHKDAVTLLDRRTESSLSDQPLD